MSEAAASLDNQGWKFAIKHTTDLLVFFSNLHLKYT